MRPDLVLPHGAGTAGTEAPRQRRAQRAEGKRLRGVAPVVASAPAAPERMAAVLTSYGRFLNPWSRHPAAISSVGQ
jgi:hypothetical protein